MRVDVESRHIDTGKCKNPSRCMIAKAIKEMLPDASYIKVRTNGITIVRRPDVGQGTKTTYQVPIRAARAIIAFDNDEDVRPFSFNAKEIESVPAFSHSNEEKERARARTKERQVEYRAAVKAGKRPKPSNERGRTYASRIAGV